MKKRNLETTAIGFVALSLGVCIIGMFIALASFIVSNVDGSFVMGAGIFVLCLLVVWIIGPYVERWFDN